MSAPAYKLTHYFLINSVIYWEHNLPLIPDKPRYFLLNDREVTVREMKALASVWEPGLTFGPFNYFTKSAIRNALHQKHKVNGKVYPLGGFLDGLTVRVLQQFVDYLELSYSFDNDEKTGPHETKDPKKEETMALELCSRDPEEKEGEGKKPVLDELEGDELLKKIADNLQKKLEAVRRYKKVYREVALMKEDLARKEEDLKECERVIQLESAQV